MSSVRKRWRFIARVTWQNNRYLPSCSLMLFSRGEHSKARRGIAVAASPRRARLAGGLVKNVLRQACGELW